MKKILATALAITMILGAASAAYAASSAGTAAYSDVKSTNWANDAITTMSVKGIVKGYPNGSFKPDNTLTYGEFIKMALIAATNEDVGNASVINEQTGKKKNWAQGYYEKALELKYFRETQISLSQITNPITRGDMAIIISAILGDVKIDNYDSLKASITDVDAGTKNEYDIIKAYANGILTGYTDKTFKPDRTLSRAESAVITYRLVDSSKREMPGGKKEEVPINRDYSNVDNLSETSTSTLPVTDIASNIYSFTLGNLPDQPSYYKDIKYYEIIKNYPYEIKKGTVKDGSASIDVAKESGMGCAMLIKDNKINCRLVAIEMDNSNYVSFCQYKSKTLPDYDYIAFYTPASYFDTLILVPNPF